MRPHTVVSLAMAFLNVALRAAAITPPDKVDFNYPPPPTEGKAGFFTVAEEGQLKCCVVLPERPKPEEARAASTLQTYLSLVTGAPVRRCNEANPLPGLNQIHVGETATARAAANWPRPPGSTTSGG